MPDKRAIPTLTALLEAAHRVGQQAAAGVARMERDRRLGEAVVGALVDSGLMKILQPARFGGYELGFPDFVRVALTLARYDVSTAWVYCILEIHHWWAGFVEPELQEELWHDNPDRLFVDSFAPVGQLTPANGGYRLSGHWKFVSGVPWADYAALGAMAPPVVAGGPPEYLMLFVPKADYEIQDDWYTLGLRGSASCAVKVADAFVPMHRVFRMGHFNETGESPGRAYNPGALYRIPIVGGLGVALTPPSLGGAQAMLARFRERAAGRVPLFSEQRQAEMVGAQILLAESTLALDAIEQLLFRYADELTDIGATDRTLTKEDRTRQFAWRAHIAKVSRQVGHALFDVSGAHAIFEDEPLQRFWRDLHVTSQHVALNYDAGIRNYGRSLLGMEPDATFY